MAGIGFELRRILKKDSLLSLVQAYGLAGMISSGPWVLSILALLCIGMISVGQFFEDAMVSEFLVIVTYLMSGSLILSGFYQLMLTRYFSDLMFVEDNEKIVPNLIGSMLMVSVLALIVGIAFMSLAPEAPGVKVSTIAAFILLCNQWLVIIFLSGMKQYYQIFFTLLGGYALMVLMVLLIPNTGLFGLMDIFCFSQSVLLFTFLFFVIRDFPANRLVSFDFLSRKHSYYSLAFCGIMYNIGVWADKFAFWAHESTSYQINAFFRASYIYDLPIFVAYLAIVPGMAIFMMRMETDYAEACESFYDAVRSGGTLSQIDQLKDKMVIACRAGIYQIFKVQGITLALLLLWGRDILQFFNIDLAYLHLLYVDLVGVSLQVLVMAILNVMFYLDKRYSALALTCFMAVLNYTLSEYSIHLGPEFYGFGFSLAMLATTLVGLVLLDRQFSDLEYRTFMLQQS